ncbi:hypothetical protein [Kamptonema formosum]|uniref:hypothetical protein n=1 Tax=Kamptonema formosum TaxID=331992 RepID=UPI00034AD337|nr:hypothetical protein [Oscillatoria sp. PCC 10802]
MWVGRAIGSGKWAETLVEFVGAAKESGPPNAVVNLSLDLTQVNPDGSVTTPYEFTPQKRAAIEYARQQNLLIVAAENDGGVMFLKSTATDLGTPNSDAEMGADLLNMAAAVMLAKVTAPEEYDVLETLIPETCSKEGQVITTERAACIHSR